MSVFALVRPDSRNFPLFVHVLGAMLLVGAVTLAASAMLLAWRNGELTMVRLGNRALLLGAIPAWVIMRVGAQWIANKEQLENSDVSWIGTGFGIADGGVVFLLVATLLSWLAVRRATRDQSTGVLRRVAAAMVMVLLVLFLVAVWAMTTKPT